MTVTIHFNLLIIPAVLAALVIAWYTILVVFTWRELPWHYTQYKRPQDSLWRYTRSWRPWARPVVYLVVRIQLATGYLERTAKKKGWLL